MALLELRRKDRRLEKVGWGLFQKGFPVKEFRRRQLQRLLDRFEREMDSDEEGTGNSKLFVDWVRDGAIPSWAGEIRSALGKKDFAVLAKVFTEVALGEFHERRWFDQEELRVITKTFALFMDSDPAESKPEDVVPMLQVLSEHLKLEKLIKHIGGNPDPGTKQVLEELGWIAIIFILIYAYKQHAPAESANPSGGRAPGE